MQCTSKKINFHKKNVVQSIICVFIMILVSGFTNSSVSLSSINALLTFGNTANHVYSGKTQTTKYNFSSNETIYKFVDPSNKSQTISPQFNLVTIVTEFFVFNSSKDYGRHKLDAYQQWINTFLKHIINPVVIYTDHNNTHIESIFNYRLNHNLTTMMIQKNFNQMAFYKQYYNIYSQEFSNRKTKRNNPNVCIVWQLKYVFTNEIANINPFQSKYFFWFDIGTWRIKLSKKIISKSVAYYNNHNSSLSTETHNSTTKKKSKRILDGKMLWPDPLVVEKSFIKCKDCVLVANVFRPNKRFQTNKKYNGFTAKKKKTLRQEKNFTTCIDHQENLISGTWFGGTKNAINWLFNEYFFTHEYFINKNIFVGNDQHVLNFIFFNQTQHDNNLLLLNSIGGDDSGSEITKVK